MPFPEMEITMLELRPGCECCDKDLPPDALDARICSFECTFCAVVRRNRSERYLPQLRRRARHEASASGSQTCNLSSFGTSHPQARRLRDDGISGELTGLVPYDDAALEAELAGK
jgi:hypothetical protein